MSKYRQAARIDENQPEIVSQLRKLGFSVQTNMDDILVGARGKTFWFEIKTPDQVKKSGGYKAGALKPTQKKLEREWRGHYKVVHSLEQILDEIKEA